MTKRITIALLASLCLLIHAPVQGTAESAGADEAAVKVVMNLKDGGRLSGKLTAPLLVFRTEYSKMEIPWNSVADCRFSVDDQSVVLKLKSGDRLTGRFDTEKLKVELAMGAFDVPVSALLQLQVRRQAGCAPVDGMILYFPFDEDSDDVVHDASGNNNDGKVQGARHTSEGKIGGAYEFDGRSAYISVANVAAFDRCTNMTVCAWINMRRFNNDFEGVVGRRVPGQLWWFGVKRGYGVEANMVGDNRGSRTTGDGTIQPATWYHIAFTYEAGRSRKIYINGREADSVNIGGSLLRDAAVPLRIGRGVGPSETFDGIIDEVMIFNRALPADEIDAIARCSYAAGANEETIKASLALASLPARVQLDMADGSRITGEISVEALKFKTSSLGDISIPLRLIRVLQFSEEGRKAAAGLINGDVLVGEPLFSELNVKTSWSQIVLKRELLRTLTLLGAPNIGPAPALAVGEPVDSKRIADLIADLSQPVQEKREKAVRALVKIGAPALTALKKYAGESSDAGAWWAKAAIQEIEAKTKDR